LFGKLPVWFTTGQSFDPVENGVNNIEKKGKVLLSDLFSIFAVIKGPFANDNFIAISIKRKKKKCYHSEY